MELRLRKRIVNRYDDGKIGRPTISSPTYLELSNLDYKVGIRPDLSWMNLYAPKDNDPLHQTPSWKAGENFNGKMKPIQQQGTDFSSKFGSGIQGAMSIYNNYNMLRQSVKDVGDLMTNAGTSNNSVMGIGYTQLNDIDGAQAMKEVNSTGLSGTLNSTASGAMAGASIAGPWGAVAGGAIGLVSGLFGWGSSKRKQRERIWNAQLLASRTNLMNRSVAATEGLQLQYYLNNGNTTYGLLYANRGKDLKRPKYEY